MLEFPGAVVLKETLVACWQRIPFDQMRLSPQQFGDILISRQRLIVDPKQPKVQLAVR
jgi:hypothetical protein